jgi:SAM-dependent methyltransferase
MDRAPDFLFDRREVTDDVWMKAWEANRRLAAMYHDFVEVIVNISSNGSILDFGCNTGYLPVAASLAGVPVTAGLDHGNYSRAFEFLNKVSGSRAQFDFGEYLPASHSIVSPYGQTDKFDVVSYTAVLCHVPDPLQFLKAISALAGKALLLWSGFFESDELLIRYNPGSKFYNKPFPEVFDNGTSISVPLLLYSMRELGFARYEELQWQPAWLPKDWHARRIPEYQCFRAFLFYRQ